jgi:hypothetical protein
VSGDYSLEWQRRGAITVGEVQAILAEHRDELTAMGVAHLSVFGSVARGQAGPDSDVDLLVELGRRMGYFEFFTVQERLEALLGCPVDLSTANSLRDRVRPEVERERVDVWPLVA